jgi:hypothetical protein
MTQHMKFVAILPLVAMSFVAALVAATTASAKDLRIEGSLETVENHVVTPPTMLVQLEGTGCATHFGHYILTVKETVILATKASQGTFEIETACGDKVLGTTVGQGTPTGVPNQVSIVEVDTVTGGTGRYQDATGTITVHRVVDQLTLTSTGAIEGSIVLPNHGRHGGHD